MVTGTFEPLSLDEMDRSLTVLPARGMYLLSNSLIDLLKLDPSLDLQERAPDGVQTDLSIRGGSFEQTLVLLNGQRLNDVQSGHHDMDIPVPMEAVTRVEVLRGSGSSMYGSDATAGVINIITAPPEGWEVRMRTAVGNEGINEQSVSLADSFGKLSEQLTFSRDFSSGFMPDRDYRTLQFGSTSHLETGWGFTDLTLAYMDHPLGPTSFTARTLRGRTPRRGGRGCSRRSARRRRPVLRIGGTATFSCSTGTIRKFTPITTTTRVSRGPCGEARM